MGLVSRGWSWSVLLGPEDCPIVCLCVCWQENKSERYVIFLLLISQVKTATVVSGRNAIYYYHKYNFDPLLMYTFDCLWDIWLFTTHLTVYNTFQYSLFMKYFIVYDLSLFTTNLTDYDTSLFTTNLWLGKFVWEMKLHELDRQKLGSLERERERGPGSRQNIISSVLTHSGYRDGRRNEGPPWQAKG